VSPAWPWLRVLIVLQLARLLVGALVELVPQEAYYLFTPAIRRSRTSTILVSSPGRSHSRHDWGLHHRCWSVSSVAFAAVTLVGMTGSRGASCPGRRAGGSALATTGAFSILSAALPDGPLVAAWTWTLCFSPRRSRRAPEGVAARRAVRGTGVRRQYSAAYLVLGAGFLLFALPRGAGPSSRPGHGSACCWRRSPPPRCGSGTRDTAGRRSSSRPQGGGACPRTVTMELARAGGLAAGAGAPPLLVAWGREAVRAVPRMLGGARARGAVPRRLLLVPAAVLLVASLGAVVKPNWPFPCGSPERCGRGDGPGPRSCAGTPPPRPCCTRWCWWSCSPTRSGSATTPGWAGARPGADRARLAPPSSPSPPTTTRPPPSCCSTGPSRPTDEISQPSRRSSSTSWADVHALAGRTGLFLDSDPRRFDDAPSGPPPSALVERCGRVLEEPPLLVRRGERIVRRFGAWRCVEYRPPAGP
jgi:hypothetical protein